MTDGRTSVSFSICHLFVHQQKKIRNGFFCRRRRRNQLICDSFSVQILINEKEKNGSIEILLFQLIKNVLMFVWVSTILLSLMALNIWHSIKCYSSISNLSFCYFSSHDSCVRFQWAHHFVRISTTNQQCENNENSWWTTKIRDDKLQREKKRKRIEQMWVKRD